MIAWLSLLLGSALGAGTNAYLTLLAIGLYARYGEAAPEVQEAIAPFGSFWVIVPAAVMFLIEFVADKVPAVDNLWDALHTLVRPTAAVFIGLTLARDVDSFLQIFAAASSGTIALGAHSMKAGLRGLARLNPEPASNAISSSGLSLAEDFSVAGLLLLAFLFPALALVVIGAVLAVMAVALPRLIRLALFAYQAASARLLAPFRPSGSRNGPASLPAGLATILGSEGRGSRVLWWSRCHLKVGLLDYRSGVLAAECGALVVAHRQWIRWRVTRIEPEIITSVSISRGPLAIRSCLTTDESRQQVLFLASKRAEFEALQSWLKERELRPGERRGSPAGGLPKRLEGIG